MEVAIIADPFSSGALIAGELKKYNIQAIAVFSKEAQPSYMLATYRKDDFINTLIFTGDINHLVQSILAKYNVKAVIPGAESGVLLTDQLAEKFNTVANDFNKSIARRDKFEMQKTIAKDNLLHIPSLVTSNF